MTFLARPSPILLIVLFILGAMVGSFLNVCIVRLLKGESLVSPPSHCPECKTPIRFCDGDRRVDHESGVPPV